MTIHEQGPSALEQIDSRPLSRHHKSLIGLVIVLNISEFFDMFLIGFVVSLLTKPWNFSGTQTGIILACSGLGTLIGAIIWGRLADTMGRRRALSWCVLTFTLFTILSVFTPDRGWILLVALRVLVGIGVGGLNIVSIPYVQEFVPSTHRGLLTGLGSVFIPLGLFLGALAQRGLHDNWRALIALGAIPILLLAWIRIVPESPRFLLSQGREKEAREALAWAMEIAPEQLGALPKIEAGTQAPYSLILKKHSKSLLIVSLGSFSFILGSFTIQSWGQSLLHEGYGIEARTVATLFMFVSLADLLGRLGSAWLADYLGRRWTIFLFGSIGAIGALIVAFSTRAGESGSWMIFFAGILITMAFGDGAFGILNAFGGEQFPNEARGTGLGLGYGIGASAKIIGPLIMGVMIGGSAIQQEVTLRAVFPAFILFAALLFVGGIFYLFAKETKGASLEEI
ncbi:MFS transporter [Schaalia cardiffensis]|uniref:MFS transporter n=1 Tax=Schaalia cardiffensis TaxID=181487 RepID=UPI002AB31696|nr:MFS transporter [Schaalia cardiffensis]